LELLLDRPTLLWWATDDKSLSSTARKTIAQCRERILVSAASAWEIAIKFRLGRLPGGDELVSDLAGFLDRQRFSELPISAAHGIRAGSLSGSHRDPFDRMLIAQALTEDLTLVSNEAIVDQYGIRRLW
jgi:PIN domain nuclease of toxin-antitoxin system